MSKVKITREKMQSYEDVRQSGLTNMFMIRNVIALSSEPLTKEDCLEIMENYDTYIKKYNIARD